MKMIVTVWPSVLLSLAAGGCALAPGPGERAPSFTCVLDSGERASMESLMGESGVVLYFFPDGETPGCVTERCELRNQLLGFQENGYRVVGVALDLDPPAIGYRPKDSTSIPVVHDKQRTVATLYNVPAGEWPFGWGRIQRTVFVISRDGLVQLRFEVPEPREPLETYRWRWEESEPF
ncbi:MAG: redoxin domain-containing protein [Planctomycetota bacterium]